MLELKESMTEYHFEERSLSKGDNCMQIPARVLDIFNDRSLASVQRFSGVV